MVVNASRTVQAASMEQVRARGAADRKMHKLVAMCGVCGCCTKKL